MKFQFLYRISGTLDPFSWFPTNYLKISMLMSQHVILVKFCRLKVHVNYFCFSSFVAKTFMWVKKSTSSLKRQNHNRWQAFFSWGPTNSKKCERKYKILRRIIVRRAGGWAFEYLAFSVCSCGVPDIQQACCAVNWMTGWRTADGWIEKGTFILVKPQAYKVQVI